MIVIDASAAIELTLRTALGEKVELRALAPQERLYAPHLLDLEVAQVLRRLTQLKEITAARAQEALDDYTGLLVERAAHRELLHRVWQLRDSMTAYDGAYIALAEALDAPLLTCDGRLARSHGHRAMIELLQ
ncbi:MAG: type II toxin-antitoxin system VapC family toxin [Steroidobacteraceae bacterium]